MQQRPQPIWQIGSYALRSLITCSLLLIVAIGALALTDKDATAETLDGAGAIQRPIRVAGLSGLYDERDVDHLPTVAFNAATHTYLVVWLSARYSPYQETVYTVLGIFLDELGFPTSGEFNISHSAGAARNGLPTVVAYGPDFVVAWASKVGDTCAIYAQKLSSSELGIDQLLVPNVGRAHSPQLAYDPSRDQLALAYVAGDDYQAPNALGDGSGDCGNNGSSESHIRALPFRFDAQGRLSTAPSVAVSALAAGAFRPQLAYDSTADRYLVAWEDRRNASGKRDRFDVYAHWLQGDMQPIGNDIVLASGSEYSNYDTDSWTPRPTVTSGAGQFLVAWFDRVDMDEIVTWSVEGTLLKSPATSGDIFEIARMNFRETHEGESPSGYLSSAYSTPVNEFVIGVSSHVESIWGYIPLTRIQRIDAAGQLLEMGGAVRSQAGVGYSVDYENDEQHFMAITPSTWNPLSAEFLVVYAKRESEFSSQNFDIWSTRVQIPFVSPRWSNSYIPRVPSQ